MTSGVSASASYTQQILSGRTPRSKPFRVTSADRSVKKGIMADGLQDLINKVWDGQEDWCKVGMRWIGVTGELYSVLQAHKVLKDQQYLLFDTCIHTVYVGGGIWRCTEYEWVSHD